MALPEEFLKKSPAQQRAILNAAMKAYHEAEPEKRKQAAREALTKEEPPQKTYTITSRSTPDSPATARQRMTPQEAAEHGGKRADRRWRCV